jgi:hypothetical protein
MIWEIKRLEFEIFACGRKIVGSDARENQGLFHEEDID